MSELCPWCDEPVLPGEQYQAPPLGPEFQKELGRWPSGPVIHRECLFRMIGGSAKHHLKQCSCYVPDAEDDELDPPGMSRREAARQAMRTWAALEAGGVKI